MRVFHDGSFYMVGMHGLWWIFWVLLVVGLVVVLGAGGGRLRRPPRESPHEILQRRLAAGEISPDEYDARKALLDRDARAQS